MTGASAGLGLAFASMLIEEGVEVWGTARETARLGKPATIPPAGAGGPARLKPVALDLADSAAAVRAFEQAAAQAGGFDLVVNNAGFGVFGGFADSSASGWKAQVDAMLGTTLLLSHAALGAMLGRGRGCLVNVSSLAAEFPLPFMSGYNVAKAGLSALSESLIFETRGTPVTVIDFRPGDYRTSFNQSMRPPTSAPAHADLSSRQARAWAALEANLAAAPPPERAAADLRRALLRNRSGIVRSGSFFQSRLAPVFARLVPERVLRTVLAKYYRCG